MNQLHQLPGACAPDDPLSLFLLLALITDIMSRASASVVSVMYLGHDTHHVINTKQGALIYDGSPENFHDWEFRTQIRCMGRTGEDYRKAISLVVDGLTKDAFQAASELGIENLQRDGSDGHYVSGVKQLIGKMREIVFPVSTYEAKELFQAYTKPGGIMCRQYGEPMKGYASRREMCWGMLTKLDREIQLGDGHKADLLLEQSGLTKEQQLMVFS